MKKRNKKRTIIIAICLLLTMTIGITTFTSIKQVKADGVGNDSNFFTIPFISLNGRTLSINDLVSELSKNKISLQSIFNGLLNKNDSDCNNQSTGDLDNKHQSTGDLDKSNQSTGDLDNINDGAANSEDTSNKKEDTSIKGALSSEDAKKLGLSDEELKQITNCLKLVNEERQKQGLSQLTTNAELTKCAIIRSKEISNKFDHTRPNGSDCFSVLKENNVSFMACGENIAAGQSDANMVMKDWMNSDGHRANIMNKSYNKVGIGIYKGGGYGLNWTQIFTN